MRMPFWLGLTLVVLLAALFWPWLAIFGAMMLLVGISGAIAKGRRR